MFLVVAATQIFNLPWLTVAANDKTKPFYLTQLLQDFVSMDIGLWQGQLVRQPTSNTSWNCSKREINVYRVYYLLYANDWRES